MTWISVPYIGGTSEAFVRAIRPLGISIADRSESGKWPLSRGSKDIADSRRAGDMHI